MLTIFKESKNSIVYYTEQSFEETIQNTYFIYDMENNMSHGMKLKTVFQ